ncbi:hypothetical protein [Mucilaginibacter pocheonensis]|uniref:Uncharacterized protein n=1 Tax=Mucilaginibacter pocheonensis TaxID=398050 RepID=A0ABU1TC51_9SPHI|nr:hypothetical protein [Mucilaginibacter pocheonensis]MDR6942947.1 hypothetical protein [Mucilaginibacter pocheonensis]
MKVLKKYLPLIYLVLLIITTVVACRKENNTVPTDAMAKEKIDRMIAQTPASVSIDKDGVINMIMKDGSKVRRHLPKSYSTLNKHVTDSNGMQSFVIPLVLSSKQALAYSNVSDSEGDGCYGCGGNPGDPSSSNPPASDDVSPGIGPTSGFSFTVTLYIDVINGVVQSYNVVLNDPIQIINDVKCQATVVSKYATSNGITATWSYTVNYQYIHVGETTSFYSSQSSYSTTRAL